MLLSKNKPCAVLSSKAERFSLNLIAEMKGLNYSFLLVLAISVFVGFTTNGETAIVEKSTRAYLLSELDSCNSELLKIVNSTGFDERITHYNRARKYYKHIEFFAVHNSEYAVKFFINGPLVDKLDEDITGEVFHPNGFQLLEEKLHTDHQIQSEDSISLELIKNLDQLKKYYSHIEIRDELLLEMMQLHLYRIVGVNLNGFDATYNLNNVTEALWNLEGMEQILNFFPKAEYFKSSAKKVFRILKKELFKSKAFFENNRDYAKFNRLDFIVDRITELNRCLIQFHTACGLPWNNQAHALNLQSDNLFIQESFNPRFFSPFTGTDSLKTKMVRLGRYLFFDPVLSGNGKRSCASCHKPELAFSDGYPKSVANDKKSFVERNAPGLTNITYQQKFFYDGRVFQLERQVFEVVGNHFEMRGDLDEVVGLLRESKEYRRMFNEAYEGRFDTIITRNSIQKAIGEYERSLVGMNSRFDNYLKGHKGSLSKREIRGYNLFAGKALCGSCHFFPVFNGTIPPLFKDTEFEVLGVGKTKESKELDPDLGRYDVTKRDLHRNSFKTPTVRNIHYTSPYMHNGIYGTLEEVVDFYHKGGGAGLGLDVPNQTLPFDSLTLNNTEKEDIILFMKSLNDTFELRSVPDYLPQFENHTELNLRRVGGEY